MTLTREELKAAHNNIMTVMENHIMMIAHCDRTTANLVANEVLDLDRDAERLLNMHNFDDKGQVVKVIITEEPIGIFAKVKFAYGTDTEGIWNETEFRKAIMDKCDGYTLWEDNRSR